MFAQDRIKDRNMMSNMRLIQTLMVAIFATLIAFPAFAQDDGLDVGNDGSPAAPEAPAAPTAQPKSDSKGTPVATTKDGKPKRTTIDFEDELVEGKTKNPELFYLLQKRQFNYKRLIRLRENFLPEMRKTSEDMQRQGSGQ